VSEDSRRAVWLQQARSYLRHADPVLARLIDDRPDFDLRAWLTELPPMDLYGALLTQGVTTSLRAAPALRCSQVWLMSSSRVSSRSKVNLPSVA
jgi:hypothetical protein